MAEQDAWTLMAAYTNNNALYFLGNILAVWLSFHAANRIPYIEEHRYNRNR